MPIKFAAAQLLHEEDTDKNASTFTETKPDLCLKFQQRTNFALLTRTACRTFGVILPLTLLGRTSSSRVLGTDAQLRPSAGFVPFAGSYTTLLVIWRRIWSVVLNTHVCDKDKKEYSETVQNCKCVIATVTTLTKTATAWSAASDFNALDTCIMKPCPAMTMRKSRVELRTARERTRRCKAGAYRLSVAHPRWAI